jgi:hypothetical protein
MLAAAVFCASISVNEMVAALLPVVVVIAVRLSIPMSQLLLSSRPASCRFIGSSEWQYDSHTKFLKLW